MVTTIRSAATIARCIEPMSARPEAEAQPLIGFLSNDEWDALLAEVNELIHRMEELPDGEIRQSVFQLLDGVDAIHREALRRLVRLFKPGVLEQVVTDPAIHTLMELYDLLPESAAGEKKRAYPTIPIRAARATPLRYPHWLPVLARLDDVPAGGLRDDVDADGQPLLLARVDAELFALDARCPVDGAPLQGAHLDGYMLSCPNHPGCHYDVRNGARLGGGTPLACHPVKVDEQGRVLVGVDMDFEPNLPSF